MAEGWSRPDDIFLDLDPERGIAAGQRWQQAFADAATRCEAVLFIVSAEWLASTWCLDEYQLSNKNNKKLFALLIDDSPLERLPGGLTAQWQIVRLKGEPADRFIAVNPYTQKQSPVHIAKAALVQLKSGLQKAGLGPETSTCCGMKTGRSAGGRRIGGLSRWSPRTPPSSSAGAPISSAAWTRCGGSRRKSRHAWA